MIYERIVVINWVTDRDVPRYDDRGMEVVFYKPSHNIYAMHPSNFWAFAQMMKATGVVLSMSGVNNA